jgi:Skp family chaperone for outer membrane proteins
MNGNVSSESYTNSKSEAKNGTITYNVGGDMTAKGYNGEGKHVVVDVGGNMTLSSVQDRKEAEGESKSWEELRPIRESLIKMQEDYKAQERRLTAKEKETINADFQAKSLAFENTTRAFAAEVQAKNGELSEGVVNEVKEVISIVAKEQNIKLVVDINTVLFSEGAVNLTEAVLIRYNLRYAK